MDPNVSALLYLLAAVCFIMALRGLSSPVSARRGNFAGIAGMIIAIGTTLAQPGVASFELILIGAVIGAAVGTIIALKIKMTAMPQLVAGFHSLVGLAAVMVAASALLSPTVLGIGDGEGIRLVSRIELSLGMVIGAITFTGSIVAFTKLQGLVSGSPLVFPGQHLLNLLIGLVIIGLGVYFCIGQSELVFWIMTALALLIGVPAHRTDRRRGHACGDFHAELLFRLGGGGYRLHAGKQPAYRHRRTGRVIGRDSQLHHVPRDEPLVRQCHSGRFRRRGECDGGYGRQVRQIGQRRRRGVHPEKREHRNCRAGLRHGGRPGSARGARNGGQARGRKESMCATRFTRLQDGCPVI